MGDRRSVKQKKVNNRLLYTLISLGILLIIVGGIYAVDITQAWHSANQVDFTGLEINPSKVTASSEISTPKLTATNLCIGTDCKTAWPTTGGTTAVIKKMVSINCGASNPQTCIVNCPDGFYVVSGGCSMAKTYYDHISFYRRGPTSWACETHASGGGNLIASVTCDTTPYTYP